MPIDFVNVISTVGFPIGMCLYFVFRFEKTLKENTQALYSLKDAIQLKTLK